MSRLWFSFCKASRHCKTVVWKQKNIKSTESGRLPEGTHLGGKRRQGLGEWEKYEGKNKGSQERNGSCWGRCWHPAGAQGGLRRTRRRRGLRDAQLRGGRAGRAREGSRGGRPAGPRLLTRAAGLRSAPAPPMSAPLPPARRLRLAPRSPSRFPASQRPGPASARKTLRGSRGAGRGPAQADQPQPPEVGPRSRPRSLLGGPGVWRALRRPLWFPRVCE